MNRNKRPKATTRKVTRLHAITAHRRLHRSPRKLLAAMRLEYADKLTAQREAFRNERRQQRADRQAAGISPEFIRLADGLDDYAIKEAGASVHEFAERMNREGFSDLLPPTHPRGQHRYIEPSL